MGVHTNDRPARSPSQASHWDLQLAGSGLILMLVQHKLSWWKHNHGRILLTRCKLLTRFTALDKEMCLVVNTPIRDHNAIER